MPLPRVREDAMSSIQGISPTVTTNLLQIQKQQLPAQAMSQAQDHDGDTDKAGGVDTDKGTVINLTA